MKKLYRLPNGKETYSEKEYSDVWCDTAKLIEYEFNVYLWAYDPDFGFCREEDSSTFYLPAWFVLELNERLKN